MPRLLHDLQSLLKRLREGLFKSLFRARFKYDVFISYSHRDSKEYAVNLKNQLSKLDFSCFIDEEEAPVGSSLDPTLTKALSKTAVLVFLATEWAITRPYIVSEFENFVATGRTIVPINILGTLTNNNEATLTRSPWNAIKDRKLVWLDETDEAFAKKNPSPSIADGIDKLFKYTRRNVRVRIEIIGTAVLVLLAAIGAGFVIKDKADEVKRQTNVADAARQEATKQQGIADEAGKEARRQLTAAKNATEKANQQRQLAETAKHDAETAKEEANRQQEIARAAKDEANKQQQLARTAKAEADRQQTIAHARQLANQAELDRGISSDDLLNSTSTAKRSIELHHTLEGDLALRKSLNLLPLRSDEITYRGKLTAGAASPNATAVAFLSANGEIQIHRRDKNVVSKNKPAAHTLLALSNDGQYFATAGGHTALIQNTDTDQSWDITIFEESNIKAIALSPKGNYLAMIASEDEGLWVEVWERDSRKLIGKPIHGSIDFMQLASLAFSADENILLVVGGNEKKGGAVNGFLRTWVIEEPAPRDSSQQGEKSSSYSFESRSTLRQPLSVNMVAAASKDDYLVTAGDYTAVVWKRTRLGDYEQIARIPLEHSLALAFDPRPRHLHVISQPTGWIDGAPRDVDKTVKIWDTSGQRQNAGTALDEEILGVSFSRNRDLLTTITQAIATEENAFRLWDPLKLDERKQDRIKLSGPRHFAFSGDGNYLAAEDEQGVVQLWNVIDNVAYGSIASNSVLSAIESIESVGTVNSWLWLERERTTSLRLWFMKGKTDRIISFRTRSDYRPARPSKLWV